MNAVSPREIKIPESNMHDETKKRKNFLGLAVLMESRYSISKINLEVSSASQIGACAKLIIGVSDYYNNNHALLHVQIQRSL